MGTDPASTTVATTATASATAADALPLAAGTWSLDARHSSVMFKVRHLGLANVRGRFNRFDAALRVGDSLAETEVEGIVELSSVDTNEPARDGHLLGTDFFAAERNPRMTFRSTGIRDAGAGGYVLDGELTLNGVTRPLNLAVEFYGVETLPADGSTRAGFSATTTVDRDEFGVDFNVPLGIDRFAIGKKVAVELELQFVAPEDPEHPEHPEDDA
jgi:polyisoprenoid-binding protein YceI